MENIEKSIASCLTPFLPVCMTLSSFGIENDSGDESGKISNE